MDEKEARAMAATWAMAEADEWRRERLRDGLPCGDEFYKGAVFALAHLADRLRDESREA